MADYYFEEVEDLLSYFEKSLDDVLLTDVSPLVEEILLKHIKTDIYDVYTPKPRGWVHGQTYIRRHVLEGAVTSKIDEEHTLLTTSEATANESVVKGYHFSNRYAGAFLQLLESGHMGIWKKGFPRPAVTGAQKEVEESHRVESAIRKGIKRVTN